MTSTAPAATDPVVIIGGGPAGRAAGALLPMARVIARPQATAWHAEPGLVWVESADHVQAVPFARLLLCADEKLLLLAIGCAFADGYPVVDATGATSVPGVFAAGRILGAATAGEAARQARIAAGALAGLPAEGGIGPLPSAPPHPVAERLDPLDMAQLLDMPPGPERNRAALAQAWLRGGPLADLIAPARPVGLAALAASAPARLARRAAQEDAGSLWGGHVA